MESVSLNIFHRRRLHQSGYVVLFTGSRKGAAEISHNFSHNLLSLPLFQRSSNNQHNQARVWPNIHSTAELQNRQNVNYNREH